jgi:hypothetical protein
MAIHLILQLQSFSSHEESTIEGGIETGVRSEYLFLDRVEALAVQVQTSCPGCVLLVIFILSSRIIFVPSGTATTRSIFASDST